MRLFDIQSKKTPEDFQGSQFFFAKVTGVSFDKNNPDSIGSVTYNFLSDTNSTSRGTAHPLFGFLKNVPLRDEVIVCMIAPSSDLEESGRNTRIYYFTGVNIWNHPHHSGYNRERNNVRLDSEFAEKSDVNPMLPFPGDTILEGRLGQSIRFSQSIPGKTPWTGPLGAPITILSNGQITTENGFECITEDINKDHTSLYLTSTQKLPITPGNKLTQPLSEYDKSQAILTSGRLVLNARDNNLILSTPSALEASGRTVIIKSESDITQQAERINLGLGANESVILGDRMLQELSATLTELINLTAALSILGISPISQAAAAFTARAGKFIIDIDTFKSKRVFLAK